MSTGRVTFIVVTPDLPDSICWRARQAIGEADIVIWQGGVVCSDTLRSAHDHADVVLIERESTLSPLPFYDLASRDGFWVAHIRSDASEPWEHVLEQIDRCGELGLTTELVRA